MIARWFIAALTVIAIEAAENKKDIHGLEAEATRGVPRAQIELAREYLEGRLVPVDENRALELFRAAAEKGADTAQFELAEMYACGMGEPRHDGETPFRLYEAAANQGHGNAMVQLARRYRYGLGTERDLLEAARWMYRAMGKTSSPTQFLLDASGEPLPQLAAEDQVFATFLSIYLKAWRTADPAAMLEVGRAFLEGQNGKPNHANAAFWLRYAAVKGNAEAEKLSQQAVRNLTPEQVRMVEQEISKVEAERRVKNLQPRR